ncbi:MAG: hypothetical protein ACRDWX_10585 [Acidimicrobiia bacterium]
METVNRTALDWLLVSEEPAIRFLARRDLLGEEAPEDARRILDGPKVATLLAGQRPEGGFGMHPYRKWTGAHWRLVSLVELAVPEGEPRSVRAAQPVLEWLTSDRHRSAIPTIDGLVRRCASQEGNALAVCSRLGLAGDRRVQLLAESLVEWQWPDGGWNCDVRASGRRSSFHESLPACWGLIEYGRATGEPRAVEAARRTAQLFLEHRLFRSLSTGQVVHRSWLALHYPPYWHYDLLQALLVLSRMGLAGDPGAAEALEVLERRRLRDGRWRPGGYWWSPPGSVGGNVEVVDWGRSGPNEMITLNALRVLKSAGAG